MSYHRYLKDNRGEVIDHRQPPPAGPGIPLDEEQHHGALVGGGPDGSGRRRMRMGSVRMKVRYREVRPAFTPSFWTQPLPWEDPLDRARRFAS